MLISIPLFVFMGYMVERANLIEKLFKSLHLAMSRIPGSLAVATLATCALFATATGIVGAVVTLMGLLAFPAMLRAGYDIKLSAGVITAGGCLGILIPPSVHAHPLRRDGGRVGRPALRGRLLPRAHARRAVHRCTSSCSRSSSRTSRRSPPEEERSVPLPANALRSPAASTAARCRRCSRALGRADRRRCRGGVARGQLAGRRCCRRCSSRSRSLVVYEVSTAATR